jgi:DNA polymerase
LCDLARTRTNVVFGEGNPEARLVFVGEAPGQDEDLQGRPFVGRAGELLTKIVEGDRVLRMRRSDVYICNVLKCRPPQNRNPAPDEADMCTSHYLHAQIEAIGPRALLAVGKFAIVSSDDAVGRLRGRIHSYRGTPVVVSYHPAFLLRSPNMIRSAWADLQLVRTVLDEQS